MSLTKGEILKCEDLPREKVSVPEWGGHLYVRVLSDEEATSLGSGSNSQSSVAIRCMCDKAGVRLFVDRDLSALIKKSSKAMRRVVTAALTINGLNEDGSETLRKN